jgi:MFS family permease
VAGATCLLNIFLTPSGQFLNEFLRHERGMNAGMVSLFGLVTGTPAAIGVLMGGRLADTRGRRVVAAGAVLIGSALTVLGFVFAGLAMWVCAIAGGIFIAALVPTLGVYGPELFPTSLRGRANGIVSIVAMGGSVVGLVAAGYLDDALGSFGRAFIVLAVAPLVLAAIVLAWFPETARRELEDINPEDAAPGGRREAAPAAGGPSDGGGAATDGEEGQADTAKPLAL